MHLKKKLKRSISWNGVPQKYEGCGVSVGTRKKNLICGGERTPPRHYIKKTFSRRSKNTPNPCPHPYIIAHRLGTTKSRKQVRSV